MRAESVRVQLTGPKTPINSDRHRVSFETEFLIRANSTLRAPKIHLAGPPLVRAFAHNTTTGPILIGVHPHG